MWRWFFMLAALEAGAAFVALALVPHESGGYSLSRLAIFGVLGACLAVCGFLSARPPEWLPALARRRYAMAAAIAALATGIVLFLLRYAAPERLLPYYARLAPLLWFVLAFTAGLAVFSLVARYGLRVRGLKEQQDLWRASGVALAVLLVAYGLVALTRIGLTPDSAYWAEPGVPVLGWQFALALVCAICVFLTGLAWGSGRRLDLFLAAGIWLMAVVIWLSVPNEVLKNSFYAPINPPSNQPFPNSDAGYYDSMAQSLLIGYPYQGDIPTRPLYVVFLALLHAIAGERYDLMIIGQTLLLALIPVTLYLLGKRMHSRTAGVLMALFAIFREWNSLLVSSETRVSNTKMLLSDLPTLLLLLLACLFVVRWLQRKGLIDALLAGGLVGLLLLLRTQSILMLPVSLALGLTAYGLRGGAWRGAVGLLLVGACAALVPWLVHNYVQTGQVTLDAPFEYQVIASQYKYTGNLNINEVDLQGKGVAGLLLEFALKDPKFVAGFIGAHFSATLIDSLLVLPLIGRYDGLFAPLNLYWMDWPAGLDAANAALLIPCLTVIAIGIGASWKRLRWAGMVPLAFAVAYAAANGIGRFSGWRYDLPADWVGYLYLAIGIAELLALLATVFGAREEAIPVTPVNDQPAAFRWRTAGIACLLIALVGSMPWLAEGVAPPRYAGQGLSGLVSILADSGAVQRLGLRSDQIEAFAAEPQATLQIGRVLYPRYFPRNTGLPSSHPWPAYAVRDFARVGFLLLNETRHDALIPLRTVGDDFAQGADAIILGCQRSGYIDVRLIVFPGTDTAYLAAPLGQTCK